MAIDGGATDSIVRFTVILSTQVRRAINAWRALRMRLCGLQSGPHCRFGANLVVRRGWRDGRHGAISIARECQLDEGVVLDAWGGRIEIAHNVFIGPYAVIYGHGGVSIGDHTLVSMHCRILSSEHRIPALDSPIRSRPDLLLPTRIGRDVWLGAGVTVLGGVTIGDGCVVGAGSVVTSDLPSGVVAVGVPARITRRREGTDTAGAAS